MAQWQQPIRMLMQRLYRIWQHLNRWWKGLVLMLVLLGGLRLVPYGMPIHASDLVQHSQALEFRDRQGLPLGRILSRDQSHTMTVPLAEVSPHFIQAIVAAEDRRFYQHDGVDGLALGRALLEAIQAKQFVSGASTITMQLARLIDPAPRTLSSKLKEIWTAWRLTAGMSKEEVLQAYVNRLPMGGNLYGVAAAARTYFGVPAQDLTLAQASLLAAIPNDPNRLNPYGAWPLLKKRQRYILNQLVRQGYLTTAQADRSYAEAIAIQPAQAGIVAAPHFLFWLSDRLTRCSTDINPSDSLCQPIGASEPVIQTTIDRPLQQYVETQVMQVVRGLASHNVHHAAAIVIDNHSQEVLAYVGSPNYFASAQMGRNDGVQALRQPGSTLKPFVYQLALEKRLIRPNTILADVPTRYAIPGAKLYNPVDYSETFQGPVRVRVALANSLNVPAVKVLEKIGVSAFLDRLRQLGFAHLNQDATHYGLGLALGSGEVSLWELARAYVTLAHQGQLADLRVIQAQTISQPIPESPNTSSWAVIADMLNDAHARARAFGVDSLLTLPFPAAVKTGTSSDFRDTWTVGFTTDYTVAVWVGNFDASPMQKISGVTGSAPLWNRIMLHLHEHREPAALPPPIGMVKRPICAVSGARPTPACPTVVQEFFASEDLVAYERQPDPFYRSNSNSAGQLSQFHLPPEYREWLALQPASPLRPVSAQLEIIAPRNGDVFVVPPKLPTQTSAGRIAFKLAKVPAQPVEWWLNGHRVATAKSLVWELQPGTWTLQVKSGQQQSQVQFEVAVVDPQATRRGFSFDQ